MAVVVSDTNVFIVLFRCGLLFKVFSNTRTDLVIPTEIFKELTTPPHRVTREFPDLCQLIKDLAHNPNHGHPVSLQVFDYKQVDHGAAVVAHYYLDEQATLDKGEREAIPVTIHLSATFVSCDEEAISEYDVLADKNGSSAFLFEAYCEDLESQGVLSAAELALIKTTIHS